MKKDYIYNLSSGRKISFQTEDLSRRSRINKVEEEMKKILRTLKD